MDLMAENQGRLSGLEVLRKMMAEGRGPPIAATLQFELAQVDPGRAVFRATPGPHAYNPIGVVHGGLVCTLADTAVGCAVQTTLGSGVTFTSIDLNVSYLRPVTLDSGVLRAVGTVTKPGKRVAYAAAEIRDASDKVVATATSSLLIINPVEPSSADEACS